MVLPDPRAVELGAFGVSVLLHRGVAARFPLADLAQPLKKAFHPPPVPGSRHRLYGQQRLSRACRRTAAGSAAQAKRPDLDFGELSYNCGGALVRCAGDHGLGAIEPFAANCAALRPELRRRHPCRSHLGGSDFLGSVCALPSSRTLPQADPKSLRLDHQPSRHRTLAQRHLRLSDPLY